jgi:hypothetical protein
MRAMLGLLTLFIVAMLVIIFGRDYGDTVIRAAGYVVTLSVGGMVMLVIQSRKNRRPGARPPR